MVAKITEITYEDAASLLGVKHGTISNGVYRGALTALPRQSRKPGRLALEQVQLFKDKQLSLSELSNEDAIIWHEIDRVVSNIGKKVPSPSLDMNERAIAILTDLVDRVSDLVIDAVIELRDTNIDNLTPDKIVSVMLQTKSFNQIAQLIGIDMNTVPGETMQAIDTILHNAVTKITMRLAALQLETMARKQVDQEKVAM